MAVPSSGSLSMLAIAQERLYSTYGSGTVTGPIPMYNLINGGNTGGGATAGNNYPALNTGCDPHPPDSYITIASISSCNGGRMGIATISTGTEFTAYVKEGTTENDLISGTKWVLYSNTSGTYLADGTYDFISGIGSSPTCGCGFRFTIENGKNTGGLPEATC